MNNISIKQDTLLIDGRSEISIGDTFTKADGSVLRCKHLDLQSVTLKTVAVVSTVSWDLDLSELGQLHRYETEGFTLVKYGLTFYEMHQPGFIEET